MAQRHVIAHEYGENRQERLWLVATKEVRRLLELLEPLLPPRPSEWPAVVVLPLAPRSVSAVVPFNDGVPWAGAGS